MADAMRTTFVPQFLRGRAGRLFLLTYPGVSADLGDALVVVPAFCEEMNKSRRQVALLARALQRQNVSTFVVDLFGTGDSDGDFGDATVSHWRADLAVVFDHVRSLGHERISLLAVRSGALVALDFLATADVTLSRSVLWQPVTVGKTMISQFLRLKAAASLTGAGDGASVGDLRKILAAESSVEVAGYTLSPQLVREFDTLRLRDWPATGPLHWLQVGEPDAPPAPAASGVIDAWRERGVSSHFQTVGGEPFWSTAEIALAPSLIDTTAGLFV